MAVHLTRIYTKTGDDGTTNLGDMSRVSKTDPRVEALASLTSAPTCAPLWCRTRSGRPSG